MLSAYQRKLRVAVQLTGGIEEAADDVKNNNNNIETPPTSPAADSAIPSTLTLYQSLEVCDSQTLNIHMKHGVSAKQRFDHVSHAADDKLNVQVCLLLDNLILERRNCYLLFFDAQRDGSNLILLFKLLIMEFNTRLEQLEADICKIHLMYMKSDDNAEQDQSETPSVPATANSRGVRVCHFESTLELLKWLLNAYRLARSTITCYESLDINFCIKKSSMGGEEIFDVKLSLFNLYFTKLDERTRAQLFSYVLSPEKRSEPFQHTLITSLLRDAIDMEAKTSKLLLCNIPQEMQSWKVEGFLLSVVTKLYEIFGHQMRKRSLPTSLDDALSSANTNDSPSTVALTKPRSISFNIPFNENGSKKSKTTSQKAYSNEYLNKLRTWYNKLDEGFTEASALMENYYAAKYDWMMTLMSRDIKLISQNIDLASLNGQEMEPSQTDSAEKLWTEYKTKMQQFTSEVEGSIYSEDLKVYLCTKQFAHSQQILNFRLQHLQSCKQRLINAFDEEINALSCLLYAEDM